MSKRYEKYLELCEKNNKTPFSHLTYNRYINKYSNTDFWKKHYSYEMKTIEIQWDECLNHIDKIFISKQRSYHTYKKKSAISQQLVLFWRIYFIRRKKWMINKR